ncbi:MAG: hypothetical protein NTV21_11195 [Planctomycetota bacterium]|nr:hypothetical protein [Planctomycetota bacterium]
MRRTAALLALLVLGTLNPSFASGEGGKPDRVYVKSKRDGSVSAVSGVVKRYELGKVTVAVAAK